MTVAMLQDYASNSADGWTMALASVRDLLAEADLRADEVGGDFAGEAHRIGETVGRVHLELAAGPGQPHRSTPTGLAEVEAWMLERLDRAAAAVEGVAEQRDAIAAVLRGVSDEGHDDVQRIHGDLHLGQELRTPRGWLVIDFEGEPSRPLADRVRPDSPLRDVAAMLRSFDYAAFHQLAEWEQSRRRARPQLEHRAQEWADRNRSAFCDGYAEIERDRSPGHARAAAGLRAGQGGVRGAVRDPEPAELGGDPAPVDAPAADAGGTERAMTRVRPADSRRPRTSTSTCSWRARTATPTACSARTVRPSRRAPSSCAPCAPAPTPSRSSIDDGPDRRALPARRGARGRRVLRRRARAAAALPPRDPTAPTRPPARRSRRSPTTPTGSPRCSGPSTCTSSARAATSGSGTRSARTSAAGPRPRAPSRAPRSPCGPPTPAACGCAATGTRARQLGRHSDADARARLRRLGDVHPGRRGRRPLRLPHAHRGRQLARQGRPDGLRRGPAAHAGLRGHHVDPRVDRPGVDDRGGTPRPRTASR